MDRNSFGGRDAGRRVRLAPLLLALVLVPAASASSLHDFERLHQADVDASWPFTVGASDVGQAHAIVFRGINTPNKLVTFSILVCDDQGREVWWKNGSRSIDKFPDIVPPALASPRGVDCGKHGTSDEGEARTMGPGNYTMVLAGRGAFQVTDKFLERGGNTSVNATLHAPADVWAITPTRAYFVDVTGSGISVEQSDLGENVHDWSTPASLLVQANQSYAFTVTGGEGATYSMTLRPAGDGASARTPGVDLLSLVGVGALAAIALRRRA